MTYIEVDQRSAGWFEARVGKITASRARSAMDFLKSGKEGSDRKKLRRALAGERITGVPAQVFVTSAMQRGTDLEPEARDHYHKTTGNIVVEVGFYQHPSLSCSGASPDGLVGDDGLLEIKCPALETHIGYIEDDEVPEDYKAQMTLQMICTGRKWCDFCSYYPGLPLFIKRYSLDEEFVKEVESAIVKLDEEVIELVKKILQ